MTSSYSGAAVSGAMAGVAASQAAKARRDYCKLVVESEKLETIENKQEYAECVQYLHPRNEDGAKAGAGIAFCMFVLIALVLRMTVYDGEYGATLHSILASLVIIVVLSAFVLFLGWLLG